MSRNGSGTYSLPAGNPVTTGTTISSTTHNNTMSDVASAITESIARDGQTTPTANLPMGGFKHTNVANATARTEYCSAGQAQDNVFDWLTSVLGADTITATGPIALSAYAAGQCFRFTSVGANTGAVTLNINAIGAKAITKLGTTALVAGDIPSGAVVEVVYDGTQFQIVGLMAATYQPIDALLTALAAQTTAANNVQAYSGADTPTLLSTGTASGNIPLVGTSSATETLPGLVELATTAEAAAGTDTARAVTSAGLTAAMNARFVSGTAVATTSGTAHDFTGIPSWAKRITVMFSGVSTSGTATPIVQIGDAGGIENTAYSGAAVNTNNGSATAGTNMSSGFLLFGGTWAATVIAHGTLEIVKLDGNTWVATGVFGRSDGQGAMYSGGSKTLSDVLTQIRVTTTNGTDTFDAGSVNILYQ